VGKTTVATGVMAALHSRGFKVASAKVGPDFIDPGYHQLATGRPGRNLDSWICGEEAMPPLAARAGIGSDVLVIEGVMGLFDGAGAGIEASTASVARAIGAPVVLVVDASSMSGSVAALVHGFHTFRPLTKLSGVILNRVGSPGHEDLLRSALETTGIPVVGVLHRDDLFSWRDRHLGLVPVVESPASVTASLRAVSAAVERGVDLEAIMEIAGTAPANLVSPPPLAQPSGRCRIAVAGGPAFSFLYPDNLEQLESAGAELVPFDPTNDPALPENVQGLVAGGGFPEVFAAQLGANRTLLGDVRRQVTAGLTVWAECGGMLWLAAELDTEPLCGIIDAKGKMSSRLTLGYRQATFRTDTPVAAAGTVLRGHEFHYSVLDPGGQDVELKGRNGTNLGGFGNRSMFASYLHLHLGSDPGPAERFVATAQGSVSSG
jgi:cobyrinic acid a,c-diamide synthase